MFEPRKNNLRSIAREVRTRSDKPLYAGIIYKPSYTSKGDPMKIALPLVRWLDRR